MATLYLVEGLVRSTTITLPSLRSRDTIETILLTSLCIYSITDSLSPRFVYREWYAFVIKPAVRLILGKESKLCTRRSDYTVATYPIIVTASWSVDGSRVTNPDCTTQVKSQKIIKFGVHSKR